MQRRYVFGLGWDRGMRKVQENALDFRHFFTIEKGLMIHSFIHLFNLLGTNLYQAPGIVLGLGVTAVNKTDQNYPHGTYIIIERQRH